MKSNGPNTDLWGTPEATSATGDCLLQQQQPERFQAGRCGSSGGGKDRPGIDEEWRACSSGGCEVHFSNIKKDGTDLILPLSSWLSQSCTSVHSANVVDLLGMKPHWNGEVGQF